MKTKQLVSIIVTGLVIIVVGITGVASNILKEKLAPSESAISGFLNLVGSSEMTLPEDELVGLIRIEGEIGPTSYDVWGVKTGGYQHDLYMNYIEQLMYSDENQGIMLYVDTPGGTVYETDELYLKLMEYKEVTGRPVWAYFATEACSGGYYISMAADKIYANRNCWTGSIGVIVSLMDCSELLDKIGVEMVDITSGVNKAIGSAAKEMTAEQRAILQELVDESFDQFVQVVCEGRDLDEATVRKLADGRIYSALQAKEHGLIDEIGSFEEAGWAFMEEEDISHHAQYHEPVSPTANFLGGLFSAAAELRPKSELDLAKELMENGGNGVLKYYAK